MNTSFDFGAEFGARLVYVRSVDVAELPADARDMAQGNDQIYAVHASNGERLALVKDRDMAFILARQNDFLPVTVH